MKIKLKLWAEPRVPAHTDLIVECPDEYKTPQAAADWAENNLRDILDQADKAYEEAYSAYVRSNYSLPHPERPYYWTVDDDDVDNNIENKFVNVDEWEEVE